MDVWFILQTPFMHRGMRSSIRTEFGAGWSSLMPSPMVGCRLIQSSFLNSVICAAISCIWKAAMRRQILTATHEPFSALALGRVVSSRGLPWRQPGNGLAFCSRAWNAEEERLGGMAIARADRCRTLSGDRTRSSRSRDCRRGAALALCQDCRRLRSFRSWTSPANTEASSTLGRNANWVSRFGRLVVPHALRSWCWIHAAAHLAEIVGASRGGRPRQFCSPSSRARFCRTLGCRPLDRINQVAGSYARIPSHHWANRLRGVREAGSRHSAKNLGEFGPDLGRGAHRHRRSYTADSHVELPDRQAHREMLDHQAQRVGTTNAVRSLLSD